ncbi:Fungal lipase-like domain containing protein [Trema orientale]|uniref:Fungal lipase-like domain containing protein n=1 Tax=Trema orientale TaxID=63057 RepID=A0A2P5FYE1_TREOI|nr:Fungal lipase-like domain containing protein [Trema orientale]
MACDKGFSSSYMLLKPEEVRFFDLIRILFSSNVGKRKFVDYCPVGEAAEDVNFRRRWMIFISILAQKFLLFTSTLLLWFGSGFEMWLNLVSINKNVGRLLLNFVQGKVVKPDKASETFLSFIGNLDKRLELDSSIKYGDARYYGALSMMASKASYENKAYIEKIVGDHWKMECLETHDFWNEYQEKATTQAFLLRDKTDDYETIVVAFRGTEPFNAEDWCSDFDISWYELTGVGKIHGGFMKALGLQKNLGWPKEIQNQNDTDSGHNRPAVAYYAIRETLRALLSKNDKAKYILTGHSLGGALAILFPAVLVLHGEDSLLERLEGVYTFGQPRVGNGKFGEFMEKKLSEHNIRYFRFVYGNDMVPRLPYDDKDLMFKHFGTCLYFNRHYEAKIVEEEPNKNYFSPLGAVPMMINAFWELVRSFTIPRKKGPDYKEGNFLRLFRIIGLVMPGIPAHSPQDYVNATRLASSHVFLPSQDNPSPDQIV